MNNNLLYFADYQLTRINITLFIKFANVQIIHSTHKWRKLKVMNSYEQAILGVRGQESVIRG